MGDEGAGDLVWSLHPEFELAEGAGVITELDDPTPTQLLDKGESGVDDEDSAPTVPDVGVYADAFLVIEFRSGRSLHTQSGAEP